jgi:uncharacterized protein (TIGR00296 family)
MSFELSQNDGIVLVHLARKAVQEYLKTRKRIKIPNDIPQKLLKECGVFVTINAIQRGEKELRGCIGYPYPTTPLAEAVVDSAISAATQDPRFPSLSLRELEHVVFEVSVLTPPEEVHVTNPKEYIAKIKVGQDGLIIENGFCKGLLLPQVPVEWKWDEKTFLCQCCLKAGLPPDSWLVKGTRIYKFSSIIAEEIAPNGDIAVMDMRKGKSQTK